MGGGGGSSNTTQKTYIRYADYIEAHHASFLDDIQTYVDSKIGSSPFSGFTDIPIDSAFFGTGYLISSFPALYDMYGKFMAGLDIDTLYDQLFESTVNSTEVSSLVAAEGVQMDADIEANVLPKYNVGNRDINSVMSSSYLVRKSLIYDGRDRNLSKFSAELKMNLVPVVAQRWTAHLDWNKNTVHTYAEIMKLYYSAKMDVDDYNYSMAAKDSLWPFTVLDFQRASLGALQGAQSSVIKGNVAGASTAQRALSGALAGAAAGSMISPGIGTVIGGILGLAGGLFS